MSEKHVCKCCGGKGKVKCPICGGFGTMDDKKNSTCYYCQGEKEVECPACNGAGMVEDQRDATKCICMKYLGGKMTIEEFFIRAKEGDVDAMIQFGDMCTADDINYDTIIQALTWYERAADLGSAEGAMRAVNLREILAILCEELNDFKGALKEYNTALAFVLKVIEMQDISGDIILSAKKEYENNHYRIARCHYFLDEYNAVKIYLDGMESENFDAILLRGLCEYDLAEDETDWHRAYVLLNSIESQLLSYKFDRQPSLYEQVLLVKGYIYLSHMYYFGTGVAKDHARAQDLVITAYQTIIDEGIKEDVIAKELKRYC